MIVKPEDNVQPASGRPVVDVKAPGIVSPAAAVEAPAAIEAPAAEVVAAIEAEVPAAE